MSQDTTRVFRKKFALLKKRGLITGRTNAGLIPDARSVYPKTKINGVTAEKLVERFDDVASGKVSPIKIKPSKANLFRKRGFRVVNDRVLVPHAATESVSIRGEQIIKKDSRGIEVIDTGVPFHRVSQWLRDVRKNARHINSLKDKHEYFGIRFFGGQRANFYRTIQALLDDFEKYQTVTNSTRQSNLKQQEVFNNLEILRISPRGSRAVEKALGERKAQASRRYAREKARRYRASLKRRGKHAIIDSIRAATAQRMREYRGRLKRNKKEYQEYKRKAKARAKRSRRSKKRK